MDSQTRLLSILLIFVGLVGGYAVYSGSSAGESGIPPLTTDTKDTLTQFKDVRFNFAVFDSQNLKTLRQFGEVPVSPGSTGKVDLFAPF